MITFEKQTKAEDILLDHLVLITAIEKQVADLLRVGKFRETEKEELEYLQKKIAESLVSFRIDYMDYRPMVQSIESKSSV